MFFKEVFQTESKTYTVRVNLGGISTLNFCHLPGRYADTDESTQFWCLCEILPNVCFYLLLRYLVCLITVCFMSAHNVGPLLHSTLRHHHFFFIFLHCMLYNIREVKLNQMQLCITPFLSYTATFQPL